MQPWATGEKSFLYLFIQLFIFQRYFCGPPSLPLLVWPLLRLWDAPGGAGGVLLTAEPVLKPADVVDQVDVGGDAHNHLSDLHVRAVCVYKIL